MPPRSLVRPFAAAAALIGWSALAAQLYLSLRMGLANGNGVARSLVIYIGYFTILTNALVASALTAAAITSSASASTRVAVFFTRPGVNTAIAAYIAVVGITYSLLLRHIWAPQGLQWIVDVVLHDLMPVLFLAYWRCAVPTSLVRWADIPFWLAYPTGYFAYSMAAGVLLGRYPYPFLDVGEFGYGRVLVTGIGMLVGFIVVAAVLIAAGRTRRRAVARTAR
ncbi:MAG: Pr6Pr family membrane protein [Pseudomonadota bacterium]|nr:Pr6Pr family membrane protein [Pseudomonadota bacterium]